MASLLSPSDQSLAQSPIQQAFHVDAAQTLPPPASIEIAFSPFGGATDLVIKAIRTAKKSIHVAAYSFTSRPIAAALVTAQRSGINVQVVIDHEEVEKRNHSLASYLIENGIPLRIDTVHTLQHNKYMVIDDQSVETGSFNYTAAAEHRNAENVMVLWSDPALASAYTVNWNSLWDRAESYSVQ